MIFNSFEFLLFLPLVWTAYWLLQRHLRLQNLLVVVASYVFYGWWDWRFLLLIAFTSAWSYVVGLIELRRWDEKPSRALLWISVLVNLGILGYFKYWNFFLDSFVAFAEACLPACLVPHPSSLAILLPVGISFYTFQALSYTIDVYRRSFRPTRDPLAFFAFISFFPLLVAGLWHGANWTFLAWGAFHAALFLPLLLRAQNRKYLAVVADGRGYPTLGELERMAVTFALALFGWVLFRAESLAAAGRWLWSIFDVASYRRIHDFPDAGNVACAMLVLMFVCEWFNRREEFGCARYPRSIVLRRLSYFAVVFLIFMYAPGSQTFIYFQF